MISTTPLKGDGMLRELQDTPDLDKYLPPSIDEPGVEPEVTIEADTQCSSLSAAPSKYLYCPICMGLLRKPMRAPCGHSFCRRCIDKWLEINSTCPQDRSPLHVDQLHNDFITENLIAELPAVCPYRNSGDCSLDKDGGTLQLADARKHVHTQHRRQIFARSGSVLPATPRQRHSFSFVFVLFAFAIFDLLLRLSHDTIVEGR